MHRVDALEHAATKDQRVAVPLYAYATWHLLKEESLHTFADWGRHQRGKRGEPRAPLAGPVDCCVRGSSDIGESSFSVEEPNRVLPSPRRRNP